MLYRINRFGIKQTSTVAGFVYFVLGLILTPIIYLSTLAPPAPGAAPKEKIGVGFFMVLPLIYAAIGYASTALILFIYNRVAKRVGGIELDIVYAVAPPPDQTSTPFENQTS